MIIAVYLKHFMLHFMDSITGKGTGNPLTSHTCPYDLYVRPPKSWNPAQRQRALKDDLRRRSLQEFWNVMGQSQSNAIRGSNWLVHHEQTTDVQFDLPAIPSTAHLLGAVVCFLYSINLAPPVVPDYGIRPPGEPAFLIWRM